MLFNLCLILCTFIIYFIVNNFYRIDKTKKDLTFLKIMFIIFFIVVATREMTIGSDTPMYLKLFENCSTQKWDIIRFDGYFEGGYLIFNVLLSYISSSKRFFMIIMSAIFNFVVFFFIKKNSKNYLLSTIMYICLLYLYTSMTMMRQYLALMIILSSFKFIKEKKLFPFILSVILSSFFHSSSWLTLLLYPIYNAKFNNKRMIVIFIISIFATINIGPVIEFIYSLLGRTNYYTDRIGSDSIANTLFTIVYLIMFLFAIYEVKKKRKNSDDTSRNIILQNNSFYLYVLLFATSINMIATNMNILSRAATYFDFLSIIALPNIIEGNVYNIFNKKILNIFIYIILIAYSSTIIYFRPEWNTAYNYKSCIIEDQNDVCK